MPSTIEKCSEIQEQSRNYIQQRYLRLCYFKTTIVVILRPHLLQILIVPFECHANLENFCIEPLMYNRWCCKHKWNLHIRPYEICRIVINVKPFSIDDRDILQYFLPSALSEKCCVVTSTWFRTPKRKNQSIWSHDCLTYQTMASLLSRIDTQLAFIRSSWSTDYYFSAIRKQMKFSRGAPNCWIELA